ncbi:MAG TPA: hypothetical protein VJR04_05670 [Terriglobales bacterium]|nr:hypothetical protein [Terriglobales bacterium]
MKRESRTWVERLGCSITAFDGKRIEFLAFSSLHGSKGLACGVIGIGGNSAERNYDNQ